jgi:hypothetical protein
VLQALRARGALAAPVAADSTLLDVSFGLASPPAGDEDLALLEGIAPRIASLDLARSAVTDAGMPLLLGCTALQRLRLDRSRVGDGGLPHLARLPKLEALNLVGTAVTDGGLEALRDAPALRTLHVWQTSVSAEGAAALAAAVPELRIDRGVQEPLIAGEPQGGPVPDPPATDGAGAVAVDAPIAPCCAQAKAKGKTCEHACCIVATAAAKLCPSCGAPPATGDS